MPSDTLPEKLKKRRVKLGRSLRKAADISGLSNPHLCQIEGRPETALVNCSWLTLRRICLAYELAPEMLDAALAAIAKKEKLL
jgi:predicted transcriptional regulator